MTNAAASERCRHATNKADRTRNGHQLIVALKVRHLLDPDFRTTLQAVVDQLRDDELRLEAEPVGGIQEI